jgi:hypothetical protein
VRHLSLDDHARVFIQLNPRPLEFVVQYIAGGSALMLLAYPSVLQTVLSFQFLESYFHFGQLWGIGFLVPTLVHVLAVLTDGRVLRRRAMMAHVGWGAFVSAAEYYAPPPMGPADIMYSGYTVFSILAYLQLRHGREAVLGEQLLSDYRNAGT